MTTATIITIGDELLIGQTIDTNSAWIGQTFTTIGLAVKRRIAVGDNKNEITEAIKQAELLSDIIIITGGLGPTSDDITKPTLCDYFNTSLEMHQESLEHVTHFFKTRNSVLLQSNIGQAMLPANCTPLRNEVGTAPGMMFQKEHKYYFSLPGVPFEMKELISTKVIPILKANFQFKTIAHKTLLTAGIGESFLAERLQSFEKELPNDISIAYLPSLGTVKIRLSANNNNDILHNLFEKLKSLVDDVMVSDEDVSLEQIILNKLIDTNKTLAIAESCTGGYLAHKFTSMTNASKIFMGSAVCYSNAAKQDILGVKETTLQEHTAVSEQVAIEMAENCRSIYKATYAIATTGFLEGANTYFYCAIANGAATVVKKFVLPYKRETNLQLATSRAMQLFIEQLS
jgi:nicotinamide-nucleotide amidase